MKIKVKKDFYYFLIIFILLFLIFKCDNKNSLFNSSNNSIKIDTISKKIDTIKIPSDPIIIKEDSLIYKTNTIRNTKVENQLRKKIDSIINEKNKVEYLLNMLSVKEYDTTYFFNGSKIKLKESVQGKILDRNLKYFPNNSFIRETITIENTVVPSFIISGGLYTTYNFNNNNVLFDNESIMFNNNNNFNIGIELGFKNKNGYQFELGSDLKNEVMLSVKKDIIIK